MPIRFRCAYCNQLLGIARRKAGTVVRCPNCAGQVVVPSLEEAGLDRADGPPPVPDAPGQQLFEGNEIDRLLEGAAGDRPAALPADARATSSPVAPPATVAAAPDVAVPVAADANALIFPTPGMGGPATPAAGIFLTPAKATLISVLAVVALAVAFGVGLLVGLFLQSLR